MTSRDVRHQLGIHEIGERVRVHEEQNGASVYHKWHPIGLYEEQETALMKGEQTYKTTQKVLGITFWSKQSHDLEQRRRKRRTRKNHVLE
jgi:hypothetical protein